MTFSTAATRISRRHLLAIAATVPFAGLAARTGSAHDGHDDGATPVASPEATPSASPSVNTGTGAAYFTIFNNASDPDTLLSATTDAAQFTELHTMVMSGDFMNMEPAPDGIEIPAGGSFSFDPESAHLMLVNLNHDLNPDSMYDLILTFARAGDVPVTVTVQNDAPEDLQKVTVGNIKIEGAWSRPAPRITVGLDDASGGDEHDGHDDATATPSS